MAELEITTVGTQIDLEQYGRLRDLADRNERSIAAEIRLAIRAWIASQEKESAA